MKSYYAVRAVDFSNPGKFWQRELDNGSKSHQLMDWCETYGLV